MKKLGRNEQGFLDAVRKSGRFYVGCGWIWRNTSVSLRLAESLVKRGLLVKVEEEHYSRKYNHVVFKPV